MNFKNLLLSAFIASALGLTATVQADSGAGEEDTRASYGESFDKSKYAERKKQRFERMANKLGLSEQQKAEIKTFRQNHRNEVKPLRQEKRALRKELRQLDPNDSAYAAKLADIANREAAVVRQLTILKGNKRQQMARILTPEQLAKRKEIRAKHKRHHGKKHRKHRRKSH